MSEQVERFAGTGGRVMGTIGTGLCLVGVVLGVVGVVDGSVPLWPPVAAALAGVLFWAAMLRPRVSVLGGEVLELRTMLETVLVPMAAVETIVVRQVLAVGVDGRRFVCPAIGHSVRRMVGGSRGRASMLGGSLGAVSSPEDGAGRRDDYPDLVEARLRDLCSRAREQAGVRPMSAEQAALASGVRRQPAWVEIVTIAVLVLALVVLAVL